MTDETGQQIDQVTHEHNLAVAAFEHTHAEWDEMVRAIGLDRMDEPGMMGDWSAKDLIAHLAGWQWKTIRSFETSLTGDSQYPDTRWPAEWNDTSDWEDDGQVEPINNWIHERAASMTSDEVIQEARSQWEELRAIIGDLSIDQMNDPNLFPRLEGKSLKEVLLSGDFMGHFQEHQDDDVNPWLEKNGRRF